MIIGKLRIEIKQNKKGQYYCNIKFENGVIWAKSSNYNSQGGLLNGIETFKKLAKDIEVVNMIEKQSGSNESLNLKKNKALLLYSGDDWEMLYINGILKEEGHTLNEGVERATYFAKLAKRYNFDLNEMECKTLVADDDEYLQEYGSSRLKLSEWKANYNNV